MNPDGTAGPTPGPTPEPTPEANGRNPRFTRRQLMLGGGVLALGVGGAITYAAVRERPITFEDWRTGRELLLIAHRGAGDVVPEHTIEGYRAALDWGAQALELSVVRSSDGVLYCHHDLEWDRTTTLTGPTKSSTADQIDRGRVRMPRLGPRWEGDRAPRIPRLTDALDAIGERAVLFVEAKDDAAYPDIIALLEERGLRDRAAIKVFYDSPRLAEAKKAGYPVFSYFGNPESMRPDSLAAAASVLDRTRDVLVVPAWGREDPVPDEIITRAVATRVPTLVWGVHRRSELARARRLGAAGAVISSFGHVTAAVRAVHGETWADGDLAPGDMTRNPGEDHYALGWPEPGVVTLRRRGGQAFLTVGSVVGTGSLPPPTRISVEVRLDTMPEDAGSHISLAFGHATDAYYQHQLGEADGYHALLRLNGRLEIWRHRAGRKEGTQISRTVETTPLKLGEWVSLVLEVDGSTMTWRRVGAGFTQATRESVLGPWFHIGRNAWRGEVSLRRVTYIA